MGWDYRYGSRFFWLRRGFNHIGGLLFAPFGLLKCSGMAILTLVGIFVVVGLLAFLFGGHVSHV